MISTALLSEYLHKQGKTVILIFFIFICRLFFVYMLFVQTGARKDAIESGKF